MLATVRNRRGLITSVEPFDAAAEGRVHLVTVEYLDPDGTPEDTLIWEREPATEVVEPTALPDPAGTNPMDPEEFDAMVRAARWSALLPSLDPDGSEGPLDRHPLSAPFHGAIQVEDYQLVPLLKALRMPRVSLLLADDVGLGKTIEAGLILTELLLRRRVRRVLIACPASLRLQWQQEMHDKFSMTFDIVDRSSTHALQRRLGFDANPWRTYPRVITSYHYLKQADVLEQFLSASREETSSPHLPWDLLVVDEAHNLAPTPFGEESDLCRMLQELAPRFEHRLFLTATPHNGHTRSFTGLLEMLDPVRFSRKSDALTSAERSRVEQIVVRRLKREINEASERPRFSERFIQAEPLALGSLESALSEAFSSFRSAVRTLMAARTRSDQLAGSFAIEILAKRLLSCPVAFADSWHRYLEGTRAEEEASASEVSAAERTLRDEPSDDREAESRTSHAARTVGAWLKPLMSTLGEEAAAIERALHDLALGEPDQLPAERRPRDDARFDRLLDVIERQLLQDNDSRDDERLVVFTEYKTTLDYLEARLQKRFGEDGHVRVLYGGMDDVEREEIKQAFNDPRDQVRILLATDAAAEGLNLQQTARYLLHYDIPWNPSRLEQRNGRLDRHGQARDVVVHHFATDQDADLDFLAYVVGKVDTIREDLGSTGDVFDRALERRLIGGEKAEHVKADLEEGLNRSRGRGEVPTQVDVDTGREEERRLRALAEEVDLDPEALRSTLDIALGFHAGRPRLEGPDPRGRFRLKHPLPERWNALIDDTLRMGRGALPSLLFEATQLITDVNGRPIFRPEPDTALLHLGHPLFHRALNLFARARFPGSEESLSATRWIVRIDDIPAAWDALLLLTVEEMAVNELRETFHHWVRTIRLPVIRGELGEPLDHVPAKRFRPHEAGTASPANRARAREIWQEIEIDVRSRLRDLQGDLTAKMGDLLDRERLEALAREQEIYQARHGELSKLIQAQTVQRLERELDALRAEVEQGVLFDPGSRLEELERSIQAKEEEIRRRISHYEELREQLGRERERVFQHVLPKRFALRGEAQVFPVAVEIRLPAGNSLQESTG
jgi:superfamily II DNA or RNA helicase